MEKNGKVVLFGDGQVATVAYTYLTSDSEYEVAAFTVDRDHLSRTTLFGPPVMPFDEVSTHYPTDEHGMFIRDGITTAPGSVVGAGAGVLQDTREREVYIGNMGRLLPLSSDELPVAL